MLHNGRLCAFLLFFASATFAQQVPQTGAPPAHDMSHMQHSHDGFMQGGMHHALAKGVTLDAKSDAASHTITLRIGPMQLPANTSHRKMPQPADLIWTIPLTGWLLAYHPKLLDANGAAVPGTVLHHVAFWNENRSDFLCPNKEEHIFGAGGELTDWAAIPGFGYAVEKGDRIRIETMIHNPTATSYDNAYLEITIPYLDNASPAPVKNFYPAWIDVGVCGNSSYDLPAGPSQKTGSVQVKYNGVLLGVGGHMHDYGRQLTLEVSHPIAVSTKLPATDPKTAAAAQASKTEGLRPSPSASEHSSDKSQIATLNARTDDHGLLLGIPVVTFFQTGGYALAAGEKLTVTSAYDNPTGKPLRDGAMGIVVGYFVPGDPAALNALRHTAKDHSAQPVTPHASHKDMHHEM
jgi:hypothetical protein